MLSIRWWEKKSVGPNELAALQAAVSGIDQASKNLNRVKAAFSSDRATVMSLQQILNDLNEAGDVLDDVIREYS